MVRFISVNTHTKKSVREVHTTDTVVMKVLAFLVIN